MLSGPKYAPVSLSGEERGGFEGYSHADLEEALRQQAARHARWAVVGVVVCVLVGVVARQHWSYWRPESVLPPMPSDTTTRAYGAWVQNRADHLHTFPEPNDHKLQTQYDLVQATQRHTPLSCTIMTKFMTLGHRPSRDQVEGHTRHLACHTMTDYASLGVPHLILLRRLDVGDVLRKHLDVPPHIQFVIETEVRHERTFPHATMRIDDDDLVSLEHVRLCCAANMTDVVMYPGRPYLYFEDLDIVQRTEFAFDSYGMCVFPNRFGVHALSVPHSHPFSRGLRVALSGASGFYTRHAGNNTPLDKFRPDPSKEGYQENVALLPRCKGFSLPDGLVDELYALLTERWDNKERGAEDAAEGGQGRS